MRKTLMAAATGLAFALGGCVAATPAPASVADASCGSVPSGSPENATEPKSGRKFFLEFPCGLKAGDKVTLVLNLHGGGSSGSYQRRYFPAGDYAADYKLVVVTPTAATGPVRRWVAEADDQYLRDLTDLMITSFGRSNIRAIWLAGHSQGGATSQRIICTDYFKGKVDGFLSLSGGRVGGAATLSPDFYRADQAPAGQKADPAVMPPRPRPATTTPPAPSALQLAPDGPMSCSFSHIFAIGQYEILEMPSASVVAERFGCTNRVRRPDVVDERAGFVYDPGRQNPATLGWGRTPGPGTARMWVYEGCRDGRVVADVMRMDKGHTEGLEPKITEEIVKLMVSARAG